MVSRKIPVPRGRGGSGSAGRAVSRPGVNSTGESSNFQSPYQPPDSIADLHADIADLDPEAWHLVMVADTAWRVKTPSSVSLALLAATPDQRGADMLRSMNEFLARHMHPADFASMLERMVDPDDQFGSEEYQTLYRAAVTMGTARPFRPCSDWSGRQRTPGESSGQSSFWAGWPTPSRN